MPLSARDAFKTGFLARCAEDGLSAAEILHAVKEASDKLAGLFDTGLDLAKGAIGFGAGTALPVALAAPPVLGGLAGYGLARAADIDDTKVDEIKDREVLNAYKTEAAKLRRQRAVRDYARARHGPGGRLFY